MKHPLSVMFSVLVLTIFSTLYDGQSPEQPKVYRTISSVEVTDDGLCIESDSSWGKGPAPLTKESICKCHPEQCPKAEIEDKEKSYPIEGISKK